MPPVRNISSMLVALLALCAPLHCGDIPFRRWTAAINGAFPIPASEAMRGDPEQFWKEVYNQGFFNGNHSVYPFGGDIWAWSIGGQAGYRFEGSSFSVYGGIQSTFFVTPPNLLIISDQQFDAHMIIISGSFGVETLLIGDYTDRWATFGKIGLLISEIGGKVKYLHGIATIPYDTRFGIEAELGQRLTFSGFGDGLIPISVEVSALYSNTNLLGRSFTPPTWTNRRSLNDGPNPNDPNDPGRSIAFLSLRLGLRLALDINF